MRRRQKAPLAAFGTSAEAERPRMLREDRNGRDFEKALDLPWPLVPEVPDSSSPVRKAAACCDFPKSGSGAWDSRKTLGSRRVSPLRGRGPGNLGKRGQVQFGLRDHASDVMPRSRDGVALKRSITS